jgi:hypothetical protein
MAEKLDPKETISILELTVSHMWSIAGLVEVLERKGVLTKQDVREAITELRERTPGAQEANPSLDAIPEPYVMTEVEDKIMQAILVLLNANGLTARQAKALLGRLLARRTTH